MIVAKAILQIMLISLITPEISFQQNGNLSVDPAARSSGKEYSGNDEIIFIHTDRDEYIAGEYLWFAAYLTDKQKKGSRVSGNTAYIELLSYNNIPIIQKYINIVNGCGHGAFVIPDTLRSGSYIIRAYTNLMKNFSPEQCFMKSINIYNTFGNGKFTSVSINGTAPPPGCLLSRISDVKGVNSPAVNSAWNNITVEAPDIIKRREKITLDITIDTALVSSTQKTHLSISVSSRAGSEGSMDLSDYLTNSGPDTSGWMATNKVGDYRYKSEEDGRFLYGRIISQNLKDNPDNKTVLLSVPGKGAFFQYAVTDSEGNFSFKINDDWLQKDLIFQVADNPENDLIRLTSSFWDKYPDFQKISDTIYSEIPPHIEEWSVNYQVARVYETRPAGGSDDGDMVQRKLSRFYGVPDFELIMADYILLPAMQEVFFELIPGVSMRTGRAHYGITVFNPRDNKPYDTDATLMVDGIIISDPSIIVEMNPEIVERIDIVSTEYMVGGYHFYGIVNVVTKEGNFNSLPLPQNAIKIPYREETGMVFISPDHSSPEAEGDRIPDYRNTLYWNPAVETDKQGKARVEFWASDFVSEYEINIQGITDDGKPISFKKLLRIH